MPAEIALSLATQGLTSARARQLAREFGPNTARPAPKRSAVLEFLGRFRSPLVVVLLCASLASAFTGDVASFVIIVTMVALSVTIDFVQEHRAGRAAQALLHRVQVHATVVRDAVPVSLPVARLVPGDVVLLSPGCVIPADGHLVEANGLHVNEALLTGEPFPREKRPQDGSAADLFMGSSVVSGTGTLLVTQTGSATEVGKIAGTLAAAPPPTSFERGTRAFGMLVMRLTAFMVLFVILVNAVAGRPLLDSLLFAIALAVGLTPELLPMIVTVTLAHGAQRLAGEHVIVKRLVAIEGLGSMDVLCTDKTGTLTQAKIRLERHVGVDGASSERVVELAALNSAFSGGIHSPLDEAILAHAPDKSGWTKVAETPFDFERRRVAVLLDDGSRRLLVVKGAAEGLLERCTRYEPPSGAPKDLDKATREAAAGTLAALEREGLRVVGVASRPLSRGTRALAEEDLVFAGFAAFADPPKQGASAALSALAASGVQVKILTGDSEAVTRHVCDALAIPVRGVLAGEEIARLDDPALAARVEDTTLFCRVDPAQKNRIVQMLRSARPRGGIPRRRHQRRSGPAFRRRGPFGAQRRGRRARSRRHDPAAPRPGRRPPRRARGAAHLRQHPQVPPDGNELELRQHVQHGGRRALPAVPADAAHADPAQQPPLRRLGDPDPARQRGSRRRRHAAEVGHAAHPRIHVDAGPGELALRLPHLLRAASSFSRRTRGSSTPGGSSSRSRRRCW